MSGYRCASDWTRHYRMRTMDRRVKPGGDEAS
jgi:hypothetical protein